LLNYLAGVRRKTPEGFSVFAIRPASTHPGSLLDAQNLLVSINVVEMIIPYLLENDKVY
jgi:hypothetical protein